MGLTRLPRLAPATLAAWLCPTRWAGTSQPQAFPRDVPVPQSLSWGSRLFCPRLVSPVICPVMLGSAPRGGGAGVVAPQVKLPLPPPNASIPIRAPV